VAVVVSRLPLVAVVSGGLWTVAALYAPAACLYTTVYMLSLGFVICPALFASALQERERKILPSLKPSLFSVEKWL
jgi:uncharacterized membrane protein